MIKSTLAIVAAAFSLGLAPDPEISMPDWAGEHLVLADGPAAGSKWDVTETPYAPEILHYLHPSHPCNRVTVRKSGQTGVSQIAIVWFGYLIDIAPSDCMLVQPTKPAVREFHRDKLKPTIEQTEPLRRKVRPQKSRSGDGSTSTYLAYPGGSLILAGANSSADLSSKTRRYIGCDETDRYPEDLDGQGAPMAMVDARQIAYHASGDYKKFEWSTPTNEGESYITEAFEAGDQRFLYCPCPFCGWHQRLQERQLVNDPLPPYNARLRCLNPSCGREIGHTWKRGMIARGVFIPTAPDTDGVIPPDAIPAAEVQGWRTLDMGGTRDMGARHPSFHVDTFVSNLTTWDKLVEKKIEAERNPRFAKGYYNLWLGQAYQATGEVPDAERLAEKALDYALGHLPDRTLFCTGFCDVQHGFLKWGVYAWDRDMTGWMIDRGVISGDPSQPDVWRKLASVVVKRYPNAAGRVFPVEAFGVDSGYLSNQVYLFTRTRPNVYATDGRGRPSHPPVGPASPVDVTAAGKTIRGGAKIWPLGTWSLKAETYGALAQTLQGPGEDGRPLPGALVHDRGFRPDDFHELTAEALVEEDVNGRRIRRWAKRKKGQANEWLDIAVGCRALAYHLYAGYMQPADWDEMEKLRLSPPEKPLAGDLFAYAANPVRASAAPAGAEPDGQTPPASTAEPVVDAALGAAVPEMPADADPGRDRLMDLAKRYARRA